MGPTLEPTGTMHCALRVHAALDGIGKRHRAVPGQLVGIAHILHQLGLDLGECLVVLLPRQYLVVHPGATLRADDPVNGRFDFVEHQGRLSALNERLRIFLRPLHAVVEVFIQRLLKAVAGLPGWCSCPVLQGIVGELLMAEHRPVRSTFTQQHLGVNLPLGHCSLWLGWHAHQLVQAVQYEIGDFAHN